MALYAKVVLGLPVEGPFDYSVPLAFYKKIRAGMRVEVQFRSRRMLAYIAKLSRKTNIGNVKPLLEIIDDSPALDKDMLSLTRELSNYYGCSWGEAIETALPEGVRKGRRLPNPDKSPASANVYVPALKTGPSGISDTEILLLHSLDSDRRWDIYFQEIKAALNMRKSVIILLPDVNSVIKTKDMIKAHIDCPLTVLYRQQKEELREWANIKEGRFDVIIGTRSAIFAPVNNLGLVIIDEEQDTVYKQDQSPHYNAREVAFMRTDIQKAKLILGSTAPSLESFYLAKKGKINPSATRGIDAERSRSIRYLFLPRKRDFPEIKIIDTRQRNFKQRNTILSKYLQDCITQTLESGGRTLLFSGRSGFATFAACLYCGITLKCPACNINLVYHFKDNILNCHYCNFKMPAPNICPNCNSGYIRYLGTGTERIENELFRLFPKARLKRLDTAKDLDISEADIFVSTKSVLKETQAKFDLTAALAVDSSLNRIDFRSTEKTFGLLVGLLGLTDKKLVIQTTLPNHYCFNSLANKDIKMFYEEELKQRKQLAFPPFGHLAIVKLRGKKEDRVRQTSAKLFDKLKKTNKNKNLNIACVNPGEPAKLRGNYYWNILIKAKSAGPIVKFLKKHLKNFSHSGIIVTVDVDPL